VAKSKKAKEEKKLAEMMLPNLSGMKFEDAVKAFMKSAAWKKQLKQVRKHAGESLDKAVAEAKTRFQKP
jgi:hypothetical protein